MTPLRWLFVVTSAGALWACQPFVQVPLEDAGVDLAVDDAGLAPADAGTADAGLEEDAGAPDAGEPDAGEPDAGLLDAGTEEDGGAGVRDAGPETCSSCHGGLANAAPPRDTLGREATSFPTVGAHQAHLRELTDWHRDVRCDDCHVVPQVKNEPGHLDPAPAELVFSALARQGNTGSYAQGSCTTWCHGATLRGGLATNLPWTTTGLRCDSCHGAPPPAPHPPATTCGGCHPDIRNDFTFSQPERHVNGVLDVDVSCGACHGVPPATGAHLAHYGEAVTPPRALYGDLRVLEDFSPDGGASYLFGCGQCHPTAASRHMDGVLQVELFDATAPSTSLKGRNPPAASWSGAPQRTCANVACHSSGQDAPTYVTTPGWTSGASLGCNGCHDNPPRYPSTDAGVANSHLRLASDGWEAGHFGGLMEYHGGPGAGAITCQACHFETVDPTSTGPSGFYWLDTTGNYVLPGGQRNLSCASAGCHQAGSAVAPLGQGRVSPLRHVNGRRDVTFDRRSTLPAGYDGGVPQRPTAPFWIWRAWYGQVENKDLTLAAWNPATKTCTNVSCHQGALISLPSPRVSVEWGATFEPNRCDLCH